MSTRTLDLAITALKSSHADLVAKEEQRAATSKGKAKATSKDETRDADWQRRLEEFDTALNELLATRENQVQEAGSKAKVSETGVSEAPYHKIPDSSITNSNEGTSDKEPYLNPFTGSYVFPETGFEPGPSSKIPLSGSSDLASVPPPTFFLEDKLDSPPSYNGSHSSPGQDNQAVYEIGSTKPRDDHQRHEKTDGDAMPNDGKLQVKPSIFGGIGTMVAELEAWITPKINLALRRTSSLQKDDASQEYGEPPSVRLNEAADYSVTTDSSKSTSDTRSVPTETLHSTSTTPQANYSKRSRLSKSPRDYRPFIPNVKEMDEGASILLIGGLENTSEQTPEVFPLTSSTSRPGVVDHVRPFKEFKADEIFEEEGIGAVGSISAVATVKLVQEDLDKMAQIQRDRELADQEAAAEAQQSFDQLVRMQREFDEESTRVRADREMALAYARDVEEATRIDEKLSREEAILLQDQEVAQRLASQFLQEQEHRQQDLQADANLAKNLAEADMMIDADATFAARLIEEEQIGLENDLAFAEQMEANMGEVEAFDSESERPNWKEDSSSSVPIARLSSANAERLESQPLRYQRFPSVENIRDSSPANSNNRLKSNITHKLGVAVPSDRASAQALFAKEQIRYAKANERWKRDVQAWQETSKTKTEAMTAKYAGLEKAAKDVNHKSNKRPEVAAAQISVERDVADCSICVESIPKSRLVRPCKHFYCRPCLTSWFQRALKEKPKKQPRCCGCILPVSLVARELGETFMITWRLFELETTTPNPLYCVSKRCAKFVAPYDIHGDIGTCSCGTRTCRHCRNRSHPGRLCAEDEDTQKVKALGKKQGWRYCPQCKHLIERTEGCLHMTCSQCRTEFCWKCGKTTCKGVGACKGGMEYYR